MEKTLAIDRQASSRNVLLVVGIILVSFNLRPAITSIGPLVGAIREDLLLSNGMAGLLTTLPLLAFAFLSPFAPRIGRMFGNEIAILLSMILLIAGILLRSMGLPSVLFIGTALIGIGIAVSNVLLPGIVKEKFPAKVALMTGVYTASLGGFAGLASGMSVPLSANLGLGWQKSLMAWVILAILGLISWLPQVRKKSDQTYRLDPAEVQSGGSLFRSKLAWQVTFFMGLQSFLFYCLVAWLPEIIHSHGFKLSLAGWMASIVQFVGIPASFLTPVLAGKMANQRGLVVGICSLYILGYIGLMIGSESTWSLLCWIIIVGVAQGAGFSLALTFFVLRAADVRSAANLSGMAQSLGYLLAAIGPILIGIQFDLTQTWTMPLITFMIVAFLLMLAGLGAGRNEFVLHDGK